MADKKHQKRIFSGVQPTGNIHLGNYLGAVRNFVKLQQLGGEALFCIVDLHAITVWQDPQALRNSIRELAATFIACGLDSNKSILFCQSQVSGHAELAWVFNCIARIGWLNRMTQFKDKAGKNKENASVGLFAYPALMAADILAYHATHVPVGEDQKQHLELTKDIAIKFNNDFQVPHFFPSPKPIFEATAPRIMSLRDGSKKMSKSDSSDMSRINIQDGSELIALKIRKSKTDQEPIPEKLSDLEKRPEANNLINIYASMSSCKVEDVLENFAGKPFSYFKPQLTDILISELGPISKKIRELLTEPHEIDKTLRKGALNAKKISSPIIKSTYDILGLNNISD
ncbi:MAG: tryptophan--tRNA ligase [Paracoccaceae bacterium]|tara:strand:+ start:625 stop:1653 length:1029 start_codon:yes stop_codon:yes gene_type:complete